MYWSHVYCRLFSVLLFWLYWGFFSCLSNLNQLIVLAFKSWIIGIKKGLRLLLSNGFSDYHQVVSFKPLEKAWTHEIWKWLWCIISYCFLLSWSLLFVLKLATCFSSLPYLPHFFHIAHYFAVYTILFESAHLTLMFILLPSQTKSHVSVLGCKLETFWGCSFKMTKLDRLLLPLYSFAQPLR